MTKRGCCSRVLRFYGFDPYEEEKNLILDVQHAFYRPIWPRDSQPLMLLMVFIALIAHAIIMFGSLTSFNHECGKQPAITGVSVMNCRIDWIMYGPNVESVIMLLFLLTTFVCMMFRVEDHSVERVSYFTIIGWMLGTTAVVFAFVSYIAVFSELQGAIQPMYTINDQKSNLGIACVWTLYCRYEIRWRHLLWVYTVYFLHLSVVLIYAAASGVYIYEPFKNLNSGEFMAGISIFSAVILATFLVLKMIHYLKLKMLTPNGSQMINAVTSIDSGENDVEDPNPPAQTTLGLEENAEEPFVSKTVKPVPFSAATIAAATAEFDNRTRNPFDNKDAYVTYPCNCSHIAKH